MNFNFNQSKTHIKNLEKKERRAHLFKITGKNFGGDNLVVKVSSIEDLFNQYDPSPMVERDLNPMVEEYLLSQMAYVSSKKGINVTITLDEKAKSQIDSAQQEQLESIKNAFSNHFKIRAINQLILNRRKTRVWIWHFFFGILFLAFCLIAAHILKQNAETNRFLDVLSESMGIIGWVVIWEPAEYFLFGWQENVRRLRDFMILHNANVEIK